MSITPKLDTDAINNNRNNLRLGILNTAAQIHREQGNTSTTEVLKTAKKLAKFVESEE